MRIDPIQVVAAAPQLDPSLRRAAPVPGSSPAETARSPLPVPTPHPQQVMISMDDNRNIIYRFVDMVSGDVIQQVPPEEVLRVMNNIAEMLRESTQKLEVTV